MRTLRLVPHSPTSDQPDPPHHPNDQPNNSADEPETTDNDDVAVIDLGHYVMPVRHLVEWYNALVDHTLPEPDIYVLDDIVTRLRELPHLPGQLGHDLQTVTTADHDAIAEDIIEAVIRLGHLAALDLETAEHQLNHQPPPPPPQG